jgi:hypothetical protein
LEQVGCLQRDHRACAAHLELLSFKRTCLPYFRSASRRARMERRQTPTRARVSSSRRSPQTRRVRRTASCVTRL